MRTLGSIILVIAAGVIVSIAVPRIGGNEQTLAVVWERRLVPLPVANYSGDDPQDLYLLETDDFFGLFNGRTRALLGAVPRTRVLAASSVAYVAQDGVADPLTVQMWGQPGSGMVPETGIPRLHNDLLVLFGGDHSVSVGRVPDGDRTELPVMVDATVYGVVERPGSVPWIVRGNVWGELRADRIDRSRALTAELPRTLFSGDLPAVYGVVGTMFSDSTDESRDAEDGDRGRMDGGESAPNRADPAADRADPTTGGGGERLTIAVLHGLSPQYISLWREDGDSFAEVVRREIPAQHALRSPASVYADGTNLFIAVAGALVRVDTLDATVELVEMPRFEHVRGASMIADGRVIAAVEGRHGMGIMTDMVTQSRPVTWEYENVMVAGFDPVRHETVVARDSIMIALALRVGP